MKILGIIPARISSKRVPFKNIQKLAGKPLIQYTIASANNSKINRLVVSTDSEKIAKISKSLGAEVPFIRPKNLSKDNSQTIDVVKHGVKFLEDNQSYKPDIVVILQPTSPLRNSKTINKSINILERSNATSVISVSELKIRSDGAFFLNKKFLKSFESNLIEKKTKKEIRSIFLPTGTIYTLWYDTLMKYNSLFGPRIRPMFIKNELESDIDTAFDMFMNEMIILYWDDYKKKFSC